MISTVSQSDADLIPGEAFRRLKVMQDVLVNVDGTLNQFLEVLSMIVDQLRAEEVHLYELTERYRKLFANYRKSYRCLSDLLRNVFHEMTNPSSLLEISSTAVSNYHFLTYELPKELELQLQVVKERISVVDNSIEYLEHEVRRLFSEVFKTMSDFESYFDLFL